MKINIAAAHRFHLLDLARELQKQGHDVKFYSYVPTKRCMSFGLPRQCSHCFLWAVAPVFALQIFFPKLDILQHIKYLIMDYYMSRFMRSCDIYIALGSIYKHSFISAKKKFGATTILEWGSKHIDEQQRILAEINAPLNQEYSNKRSKDGYEIADYIAIPSEHVKQSFIERGVFGKKLLINPYGVDLSMFHPTKLVENQPYDIIMVGGWSLRKGCDILIQICERYNYRLLHVGSIVDLEFPANKNMIHVPSVNQKELPLFYSKAKIFVLPSREEGLALVQAQAIACGLPVVCSSDTGGRDLKLLLNNSSWIVEMSDFSIEELRRCIEKALKLSESQKGLRDYVQGFTKELTWETYGERYNSNLYKIINQ